MTTGEQQTSTEPFTASRAGSDGDDVTVWGAIDGRTIRFPMEVTRFDALTLTFDVDAEAAAALIPGTDFEPLTTDGRAQLVLAACDYHENPWGDYLELNLGFLARPVGAPADVNGSFIYRMPVDQDFTCRAGNEVMGFPKTVEDLTVDHVGDAVTFGWHRDGSLVLAVTAPRIGPTGEPTRVTTDSYSYLGGRPYATALGMDLGTGFLDPSTIEVELGEDPVADELRSLGLPAPAVFGTWGTDLTATFQLGRPL